MRFIFLIFLSLNILSEPWVNISDSKYLRDINYKLRICNDWDESFISYPVSYGEINFYLNEIKELNINNSSCQKSVDSIKISLRDKFIQSKEIIFGIQSGNDDQYFQIKSNRYYKTDNVYFSFSNITSNFAYKLKVINTDQGKKNYFDESYIA